MAERTRVAGAALSLCIGGVGCAVAFASPPLAPTVTWPPARAVVGANRLKFTPDGKLVMISSLRNGDLVVYDAAARKEFMRIPVGRGAAGILMDPVGNRVFVACTPNNYVAVVDLKTFEVTGHIDVGAEPDGLAWAVRP